MATFVQSSIADGHKLRHDPGPMHSSILPEAKRDAVTPAGIRTPAAGAPLERRLELVENLDR